MSLELLQVAWFCLIFVLFTGYAILDGFDLGVGMWHLASKGDDERRLHLAAIGPVWDGNEVWLLTAGGALFAAFPPVYAVFGTSFYLAIMLLLVSLIFRAVSIEFRSKLEASLWRRCFDWAFGLGSLVAALLLGVALGNVLRGLPIDHDLNYRGGFFNLLNPYALLTGITGVVLLAMHGAAYMAVKTEADLQQRMRSRVAACWFVFVVLLICLTVYTGFEAPHLFKRSLVRPLTYLFVVVAIVALAYVRPATKRQQDLRAFVASSATIAAGFGLAGTSLFPIFIPTTLADGANLTVWNHSSTQLTLTWMLGVSSIGVPVVLAYTVGVYWVFRGKVQLEDHSY